MTQSHRRGVTRGYLGGLILAVTIVGFALLLAGWGWIALVTDGGPVSTPGISLATAAIIVLVCLIFLAWIMWLQSVILLRGKRSPSWGHILLVGAGGYLLWGLGGTLFGLSIVDTWLSPYALTLAVVWVVSALLQWSVLARRVYTDRGTPQWPWERRGEPGPDWTIIGDDPWKDLNDRDDRGEDDGPEGRRPEDER